MSCITIKQTLVFNSICKIVPKNVMFMSKTQKKYIFKDRCNCLETGHSSDFVTQW